MTDLTLQAIFGKLEEVNSKVDQIINYLGGARKKNSKTGNPDEDNCIRRIC